MTTVPVVLPAPRWRGSLALRITLACLLVALLAVGVAGLVSLRLVSLTAREVNRTSLAQQADVVAAQLTDAPAGGVGIRRVTDVLRGQGIDVVSIGPRGAAGGDGQAVRAAMAADAAAAVQGTAVSTLVELDGTAFLVEAREARNGAIALVRAADGGAETVTPELRRNIGFALLAGVGAALVVGAVLSGLLARPLRRTAAGARELRAGRRDVRIPVSGPSEIADVAGAVNELADALARSEARQRTFLLSVSHELRTPLTSVTGFAESLADGVVTGDEVPAVGRTVLGEAQRLQRLVDDLIELARLEADDFRLDPVPVDLALLVAEAAGVWGARCAAAGVAFRIEVPPGAVPVRTDPRRLRQCVDALADNALRVTPAGSPLVLAVRSETGTAVVEVRDGGPGLAPEDYEVAFRQGVLHDRYRERRGTGGIGLALVHGLVTRLGGRIDAAPAPEGGACFTIRLAATAAVPGAGTAGR